MSSTGQCQARATRAEALAENLDSRYVRQYTRNRRGFGSANGICAVSASTNGPERPPTAQFMTALSVARNVKIGLVTGVAFAILVYAYRVFEVLGPTTDPRGSPLLFLLLAVTLALATATLVAVLLTVVSAYRLACES
jgi:hypothetical protein